MKTFVTSTTGRTRGTFTGTVSGTPDAALPELKLEKRIGAGHSAEVFLARALDDNAAHAELVLKVARKDESSARLKKLEGELEREQRASETFSHIDPAFVRMFNVGELRMGKARLPAVVMEKVEGQPLCDWRTGGAKRTPAVAIALMARLTEVLDKLERAGFRHNDLHTENLFAVNDDPTTLRVIDLGRASRLDAPTKGTRIVFGAPERRAGGGTKGVASDIYTVGVVLFTLLAGTPPPHDKRTQTAAVDGAVIGRLVAGLDASDAQKGALDGILRKALALKPADRFESFAAFHRALDAAR